MFLGEVLLIVLGGFLFLVFLAVLPFWVRAFRRSPGENRENIEQDRRSAQELLANLELMDKRLNTLETILTEEIKV